MKQQTAVEWLISQLQQTRDFQRVINEVNQSSTSVRNILEKAKEMEKEQIKIAWNHGFDWGMMEQSLADQGEPSTLIDANHFYNETYGDDNGK